MDLQRPPDPFDIPFRNAIKIGAGLAIGVGLVAVAIYSILIILFALAWGMTGR